MAIRCFTTHLDNSFLGFTCNLSNGEGAAETPVNCMFWYY